VRVPPGLVGIALVFWLCGVEVPRAAEVRGKVALAHDSNLFEGAVDRRSGWVSRLHVSASGFLVRNARGQVVVDYQGGIKKLWQEPPGASGDGRGDVVINHAQARGEVRLTDRLAFAQLGMVKVKQVTRVPGEESYLRGALEGRLSGRTHGGAAKGGFYLRWGGDDSRDALLPEVTMREVGIDARFGRSRRLRASVRVSWRWLDYDRPALGSSRDGVALLEVEQSDLLRAATVGLQLYRGTLANLTYGYLWNRSNSFGYGYSAHRLDLLLVRHLARGVDLQVYLILQFRSYDDPVDPLPQAGADEYEQTMGVVKLSRQLTGRLGASLQYSFTRNGARRTGDFYRKHVTSLSLETSL
jgi:hypothetical protein